MVAYCKRNGLILNSQKTQILTSTGVTFKVKVGHDYVPVSQQIKLLGVEYNSNFSTVPYLKRLSCEAQTHAFLIRRLSFCMPPCLLKPLANGILLGKVLAAAPAALPIKTHQNEKSFQSGLIEDINKTIKSAARTITKTKLCDKVPSEIVLWKAGLPSLSQAVSKCMASLMWKARKHMNPLGQIFETSKSAMETRASKNKKTIFTYSRSP